MRPVNRMIEGFEIKLKPEVIKEHFENQLPIIKLYYQGAAEYYQSIVSQTKQILDNNGILPGDGYAMYLSFSRMIGSKIREVGLGGSSLFNEVRALKDLWVARGLSNTLLTSILRDIFGIVLT